MHILYLKTEKNEGNFTLKQKKLEAVKHIDNEGADIKCFSGSPFFSIVGGSFFFVIFWFRGALIREHLLLC